MKITLLHCDKQVLTAVEAALASIAANIVAEHQPDQSMLKMTIYNDQNEELSAKSYNAPFRLGRLLNDAEMVVSSARAAPRLSLGAYVLDVAHNMLELGEASIRLTDRESDILVYLYNHAPRVVERQELLQNIWQYAEGVETHTLETHIYRLRQKIATHDGAELLMTDDNGYKLSV